MMATAPTVTWGGIPQIFSPRAPSLCRNDSAIARALAQQEEEADAARRRGATETAAATRPRRLPPPPPPPPKRRRAAEEARLATRLRERGLAPRGVRGDGSCQFRALADQLYADEARHAAVRALAVEELRRRPSLYAPAVVGSYAEYVRAMAQPGAWGDHVSLLAACNALGVTAVLITSFAGGGAGGGGREKQGGERAAVVVVAPSAPQQQQSQQQQQQQQQQQPEKIAYLSYLGELHYDSLCARRPAAKVLGSRRLGRLLFGGGGV